MFMWDDDPIVSSVNGTTNVKGVTCINVHTYNTYVPIFDIQTKMC